MDAGVLWAMVALSAVNTVGYLIGLWIKGHYHIIETPTRMASTQISTICREVDKGPIGALTSQVLSNAEKISKVEEAVKNGGKHEASANPGAL